MMAGVDLEMYGQRFLLHPEELPIRNVDLTTDKAVAQADLTRALGTLR